ncbi:hypothetical protein KEM55_008622 [Ascosphaera atra]|nr:hypothetical protein KEM55_008622 [Ascosphaera atra]
MTDAENKVKEMWNQDDSTTGKAKDWANEKAEQTKNMGNEASKKTDNMREEAGKKADDAGHEIRKHP